MFGLVWESGSTRQVAIATRKEQQYNGIVSGSQLGVDVTQPTP